VQTTQINDCVAPLCSACPKCPYMLRFVTDVVSHPPLLGGFGRREGVPRLQDVTGTSGLRGQFHGFLRRPTTATARGPRMTWPVGRVSA
jgi:hypothetical protein